MKSAKIFGLVLVAGLALTLGMIACKKAAAPEATESTATQSPEAATTQAETPAQPAQ